MDAVCGREVVGGGGGFRLAPLRSDEETDVRRLWVDCEGDSGTSEALEDVRRRA